MEGTPPVIMAYFGDCLTGKKKVAVSSNLYETDAAINAAETA